MKYDPVKVLTRAKNLIKDPKHWVKGAYQVRTKDGDFCYCMTGAIERVVWAIHNKKRVNDKGMTYIIDSSIVRDIYESVKLTSWHLITINDAPNTTHKHVMEKFDQLIRIAKENAKT